MQINIHSFDLKEGLSIYGKLIISVYSDSPPAVYPVVRNRGHFGEVSVSWVLDPDMSGDVSPIQGNITFREGEYLKNLTLFSLPDEVI